MFISRVPSKLKQSKEILQNYNPNSFIKIDENYEPIVSNDIEYEGMKQKWILYKSFKLKSKKIKQFKKHIKNRKH